MRGGEKVIRERNSKDEAEVGMKEKERRRKVKRHEETVKQFQPKPVSQESSVPPSLKNPPWLIPRPNTFPLNFIYVSLPYFG